MPSVQPFSGLRYDPRTVPDLAQAVCPPFDVIDPAEQAALRAESPWNAVRLELPEDADGQPGTRYQRAAETLADWRQRGVLRADPRPAYYLLQTDFSQGGEPKQRRDLLAAVGVEPWSTGSVLPHEATMRGPKADRLELLRALHANVSPIWLLHRQPLPALQAAWQRAASEPPAVEFRWRETQQRLWLVDDQAMVGAIQAEFADGAPLYIADGHHRYETALAFREEAEVRLPGASHVLAAITWADDPGLVALPTHRLLHQVDGELTLEEAETRWAELFHTEYYPVWDAAPPEQIDALMQQLASSGRVAPSFGLLGLGQADLFAILELRGRQAPPELLPAERSDAWKSLDLSLLHTLLIDPLVEETHQPREQVLSFTRDPHAAVEAVRAGQAAAAFFVNPTPVAGVLAVADAHDRMPEKSTYFAPKPPAGVVLRDLAGRDG